jgi:hypothetical protein
MGAPFLVQNWPCCHTCIPQRFHEIPKNRLQMFAN